MRMNQNHEIKKVRNNENRIKILPTQNYRIPVLCRQLVPNDVKLVLPLFFEEAL